MVKQFGAMYLILGTCVAAGMLGLPVVTAQGNYWLTSLMILSAWCLMTLGAWCLLQVNLWFSSGTNLLTMAKNTLGKTVQGITWVVYLMLLMSLICAYLAGSGDLLYTLLQQLHWDWPRWSATVLVCGLLACIVLQGIRSVDLVNRVLMSVKLIICLLLIVAVLPHAHLNLLQAGNTQWHGSAWLLIITSFGYAIILPSVREYLNSNRKQLTRVLWIGSVLPVILYLIWIAVIQGALPRFGPQGLVAMNNSANTNSMLMTQLVHLTHYHVLQTGSVLFISICSVTGFLGVSLCLIDFLADGLKRQKQGRDKLLLGVLTYVPPAIIVVANPAIFIHALAYAGACCLYILVGLPVAMYVVGRGKQINFNDKLLLTNLLTFLIANSFSSYLISSI